MKKIKLVVAGTAILMCALLIMVQHNKNEYNQQHSNNVQPDSLRQNNSDADTPMLTIGLPVSL
jgi:hypothetical protein